LQLVATDGRSAAEALSQYTAAWVLDRVLARDPVLLLGRRRIVHAAPAILVGRTVVVAVRLVPRGELLLVHLRLGELAQTLGGDGLARDAREDLRVPRVRRADLRDQLLLERSGLLFIRDVAAEEDTRVFT